MGDQSYHTTYIHTHIHTRRRRPFVEYIYIYIYFVIYLFINRYYYTILEHYQEGKKHTIILSRRSTLSSVHSIPSEQLLGIYLLFGTKKKAGEEYDMTTGTRKNKRTTSTLVLLFLFIVISIINYHIRKEDSTLYINIT